MSDTNYCETCDRITTRDFCPTCGRAVTSAKRPDFLTRGLSANQAFFRNTILREARDRYRHTATLIHASIAEKQMLTMLADECQEWLNELEKEQHVGSDKDA